MALTLQSAMDKARVPLNDDAKTRYPDDELLKHCNSALSLVFDKRPDILIGSYSDTALVPNGERIATDPFPFDPKYLQPVADIIAALAQTKDEEHMDSGRVEAMIQRAMALVS